MPSGEKTKPIEHLIEVDEHGVEVYSTDPDFAENIPGALPQDAQAAALEKMARGYIAGTAGQNTISKVRGDLEGKIVKRIGRRNKWISDKLFELIEGVYVLDKRAGEGGIRYYKTPPNLNAIIYALDRVLGKPTQKTERTEKKVGLILVEDIVKGTAERFKPKGEVIDGNASDTTKEG